MKNKDELMKHIIHMRLWIGEWIDQERDFGPEELNELWQWLDSLLE